ncbi:MAG: transcriptional repressor [Bacteroidaceae bacterium]|nr:transcriptional repressor [Bacteroidaceae bacterium]
MKKTEGTQQKDTPRDILTRYMAEQGGMRKTPERYAILDVVMKMKGHHSADQILDMMPETFHVSRATMYSTLTLLVKCGLLYNHQTEGATLYECAYKVPAHHHYICTGCNKIWDLKDSSIERAASKAKTPRFKKLRCSTYIYGLCNICQAKLARLKKKLEQEKKRQDATMTREEKRFAQIDRELSMAADWFK